MIIDSIFTVLAKEGNREIAIISEPRSVCASGARATSARLNGREHKLPGGIWKTGDGVSGI
jgi:hypothetical protein